MEEKKKTDSSKQVCSNGAQKVGRSVDTLDLALNKKSKNSIRHKLHIFGKEIESREQKHKN